MRGNPGFETLGTRYELGQCGPGRGCYTCVCECVRVRACECVCVSVRACVCVCVCV